MSDSNGGVEAAVAPIAALGGARRGSAWVRAMPWVFVLIWSTGFVVARLAMPHSPPLKFLSLRFALSGIAYLAWVRWAGAAWPVGRAPRLHVAATGLLMHVGYLGGVWSAVKLGVGAGTVALLVGLQPVLTAIWVSAIDEGGAAKAGVSRRQWLGLGLGFAGLVLVVWPKLGQGEMTTWSLTLALIALFSITAGTLYQKRFVAPCDVRSASAVQMLAAFALAAPLALFEPEAMDWHVDLVLAMAWSVGALTLGGSSLLYLLIQRGEATTVTSLLYLVPPCTAALAWLMFGETLTALMLAGMAMTAAGVAVVVSRQPSGAPRSNPSSVPEKTS